MVIQNVVLSLMCVSILSHLVLILYRIKLLVGTQSAVLSYQQDCNKKIFERMEDRG
jgi:hypothetical protein